MSLDTICKKLDDISKCEGVVSAIEKSCLMVERTARQKAPKDTGALRRSIAHSVDKSGDEIKGEVYTPLEFAAYMEYGTGLFAEKGNGRKDVPWAYKDDKGKWHSTSGTKPHPFMRPALQENRDKIAKILKEGILND